MCARSRASTLVANRVCTTERSSANAITNVRVDGYPVTNPVGFTGKNLEVTVFNTFAPMTHIDAIETVVDKGRGLYQPVDNLPVINVVKARE